jgi:hypothetical protein
MIAFLPSGAGIVISPDAQIDVAERENIDSSSSLACGHRGIAMRKDRSKSLEFTPEILTQIELRYGYRQFVPELSPIRKLLLRKRA